jgi:hypothetical protein
VLISSRIPDEGYEEAGSNCIRSAIITPIEREYGTGMPDSQDLQPSWALYRKMAQSPDINPARRQATTWALDELEHRMGANWLERYWETAGHVPSEVNLGSAHVSALGNLLDFALRLSVLDELPGIGKVQRAMRSDLKDDTRRHCALQLEVGALALRAGCTVAFEAKSTPSTAPSDVVLIRDGQQLRLETFAIIRDQQSQMAAGYWERLLHEIRLIEWRNDTPVAGDIGERLDEEATRELLRLIDQAAQQTSATGQEHRVSWRSAELRLLPAGSGNYQLQTGVESSVSWPRIASKLQQKARQAQKAGGGWLRADIMDGTWQFTPWARARLSGKIAELARLVRPLLSQITGTDGAILSSGAGVAQGQFYGESARASGNCYGLRTVLPALRVRETMVVPVSAAGSDQARFWLDLYNSEESWMDWSLQRCRLPALSEILPPPH